MSAPLPPNANLEQLQKQAKDLRKAHQTGDPEAIRRLKTHLRRFAAASDAEIRSAKVSLRDAQHIIARELGFDGWQPLVAHLRQTEARPTEPAAVEAPPYAEEDLIPVHIDAALPYHYHIEAKGYGGHMILLKSGEDQVLPIVIGDSEGRVLSFARGKKQPHRPLAHQLLQNILDSMNGQLRRLVIHDLKNDIFYAHLLVETPQKAVHYDCRPSDGLILAAQKDLPIYLTPEVLAQGRPAGEMEDSLRVRVLKSLEKKVRLEDAAVVKPSVALKDLATHFSLEELASLEHRIHDEALLPGYREPESAEICLGVADVVDFLRQHDMHVPPALAEHL